MPRNDFKFKDHSTSEFGLMIATHPNIPIAQKDETQVEIPGRDGTVTRSNNRHKNVNVTYQVGWRSFKLMQSERIARAIKAWLCGEPRSGILSDTYDREYFRKARFNTPVDFTDVLFSGAKVNLTFTCHPFKYSWLGQNATVMTKDGGLVNLEAFPSKPYLKIYGTGGELYVNNSTIILKTIDEYIEIDSEAMSVFKEIENKSDDVQLGEFPQFAPGENTIQWDGGIEKIEIIPRWCTL